MKNIKEYFSLDKDLFIENIMVDSRVKLNNSIFFCIVGFTVDGHDFIDKAIENGAVCIVTSKEIEDKNRNATYIKVDDTIDALNKFADYFYDEPSKNMKMYGVTGTNGKTTISYITYDLLNKLNQKAGYIGTLGYEYDGVLKPQYFTTPNINDLHMMLKEIKDSGCDSCCLEVSSQGLDLHRSDSVDFDVAVYTNLTHEHFDYHKTIDNYFNAKARLFENLKQEAVAIINVDDEYGLKMIDRCKCKVVTYGIENDATYKACDINLFNDHSEFNLLVDNKKYFVKTNMVALFNIYNLLACIASLVQTGYELDKIIPLLENISLVPGRCMHIDQGQDFNVIVDFAHTPDGFDKILNYARNITEKSLRVIFGMPGSRDREKRAICGGVADKYCDEIILTSDDDHHEKAEDIIEEIKKGISKNSPVCIIDRIAAIEYGIKSCNKGDTLCILCKGTDDFFKQGDDIIPYEGDHNVAARILKNK